jgi:arabinogalactan endo-1,4-beta-galactosidase
VEYSPHKRQINDLMFNTPDKKGLGTFIWEPTRHREALFDKEGRNAGASQESAFGGRYDANRLLELYPQMARDYAR